MKRKGTIAAVVAIVLAASAALAVYISQQTSSRPPEVGLGALDGEIDAPVRSGGVRGPIRGGAEQSGGSFWSQL